MLMIPQGGTPLYTLHRYVRPLRVWLFKVLVGNGESFWAIVGMVRALVFNWVCFLNNILKFCLRRSWRLDLQWPAIWYWSSLKVENGKSQILVWMKKGRDFGKRAAHPCSVFLGVPYPHAWTYHVEYTGKRYRTVNYGPKTYYVRQKVVLLFK